MSAAGKILLVEDERDIARFLSTTLEANGYDVVHTAGGRQAIAAAASHVPDLMLLDLGLPDMDGMEVLRSLREWTDIPVIVVSARQEEGEKVLALDGGADDYVTKPFGNDELLARIRTALRRYQSAGETEKNFLCGGLAVDFARRQVSVEGTRTHLTPIEYKLVSLLARNAGKVLTHDFLLQNVWGPYAGDSQVLRVNMANIRRKLEPSPGDPRYILTEVGVGYRMVEPG